MRFALGTLLLACLALVVSSYNAVPAHVAARPAVTTPRVTVSPFAAVNQEFFDVGLDNPQVCAHAAHASKTLR